MPATKIAAVIGSGGPRGPTHPAPVLAHETLLMAFLIAAIVVAAGAILLYVRGRVPRAQPVAEQSRAFALMGELCPYGWQAEITMYGWGAPVPDDAPQARVPLVELEWKLFDDESGRVAVARRVWATSIGEALQTMVDHRRTDIALEEIEQSAAAEEDLWWND
jgi:hypothetical protein